MFHNINQFLFKKYINFAVEVKKVEQVKKIHEIVAVDIWDISFKAND